MDEQINASREALASVSDELESVLRNLKALEPVMAKPFQAMEDNAGKSGLAIKNLQQEIDKFGSSLSLTFSRSLKSAIRDGEGFLPFLDKLRSELEDFILQTAVVNPALNGLFGGQRGALADFGQGATGLNGANNGLFGSLVSGVADLFAARAFGGPVGQGQPYLVGERGPELFVPQTAGGVVPHAGAASVNVTMNITTPDAGSFRASQTQIAAAMADAARRAGRIR